MRYRDIDWQALWQKAHQNKSRRKKQRADWDRRAAAFSRRNQDSSYAGLVLSRLEPKPDWTVLDVGCGPGTLALPLAGMARQVTALDYSPAMLRELRQQAVAAGCENILPVQASWEDDWQAMGIEPHHLVIASRSLAVDDLVGALKKLDRFATQAVYVVDRVGSGPLDPTLFAAIGREFEPGPDYIFTLNILYTLGIYPRVDFIRLDDQRTYPSRQEALESCRWMLDDLTSEEELRLIAHLDNRLKQVGQESWQLTQPHCPRWAVISWLKDA